MLELLQPEVVKKKDETESLVLLELLDSQEDEDEISDSIKEATDKDDELIDLDDLLDFDEELRDESTDYNLEMLAEGDLYSPQLDYEGLFSYAPASAVVAYDSAKYADSDEIAKTYASAFEDADVIRLQRNIISYQRITGNTADPKFISNGMSPSEKEELETYKSIFRYTRFMVMNSIAEMAAA